MDDDEYADHDLERGRFPNWSDDNKCLRCDKEIMGFGMLYCGACYREGNRNSGLVGPLFGYGDWR